MAVKAKKTIRKPTKKASPARAAKATSAPETAAPSAPAEANPAAPGAEAGAAAVLKKPELLERALARCEVKKRDAKPAIEAALAVLGEALAEGEELVLPPLGRIKVTRRIEKENADVFIARIRRPKTPQTSE